MRCIVLDAMGVIFNAGDDMAELLIPFIKESNENINEKEIESAYFDASIGKIDPGEFWNKVGLDPSVENDYLMRHSLVHGAKEFLKNAKRMNIPVWCLSNDVGRWARKLQKIFSIEKLFADSVISSEVQIRKPNCAIYQYLLDHSGFSPNEILFVDDRKKNVDTAIAMGIPSIQFSFDLGYDGIEKKYLLVPPDQDEYNNLPDIV